MSAQLPLGDFAPEFLTELSQYHTPPSIARQMANLLPPETRRVLEPSAGGGTLVDAAFKTLQLVELVQAVEIDGRWVRYLSERFLDKSLAVRVGDFMGIDAHGPHDFDAVLMNPPLDGGVGPHHVSHALEFAPQVVSILRAGDMHTRDACACVWSSCDLAVLVHLISRGGFKGARTDFVVVDVRRPGTFNGPTEVEWWEA